VKPHFDATLTTSIVLPRYADSDCSSPSMVFALKS